MSRENFLVVFKDGTRTVINNVSDYVIDIENKVVKVTKNSRISFFNFEEIRCCGSEWDLNNKGE